MSDGRSKLGQCLSALKHPFRGVNITDAAVRAAPALACVTWSVITVGFLQATSGIGFWNSPAGHQLTDQQREHLKGFYEKIREKHPDFPDRAAEAYMALTKRDFGPLRMLLAEIYPTAQDHFEGYKVNCSALAEIHRQYLGNFTSEFTHSVSEFVHHEIPAMALATQLMTEEPRESEMRGPRTDIPGIYRPYEK